MSFKLFKPSEGEVILLADGEDVENLKQIFARACNSWEKAPITVLELHDVLLRGKEPQNYAAMPRYKPREDLYETERFQLDQRLKTSSEKAANIKTKGQSNSD